MAEVISDRQVVAVLRPFVAATAPVLDALREADPLGLRAKAAAGDKELREVNLALRKRQIRGLRSVRLPGTGAWERMDPQQRESWWINRVGRITSLVTALPGLGGALADRLPVQDTVGAAAQGLLLCAIAGERGVTDKADRVRLLAWVLFGRRVEAEVAAGEQPDEQEQTAELTEDVESGSRLSLSSFARTLWRLGRQLRGITGELEKRPQGRLVYRIFGVLPLIGMFADYLAERSALKKVTKRARKWFRTHGDLRTPG